MTHLSPRVEEDSPGLFVNPDWQPGTPGTFAVIIGVSEYPYLEGGDRFRDGDDAFTLGQLHVSAATARAFFTWFTDSYNFPAAPPARCWLLLSPTRQELDALGVSGVDELGAAPATLANCELALHSWYEAMGQVTMPAAVPSRSIFFFSGHGLEVAQEAQILLPSDYLRRPGRSVNDAISTANLIKGLASSTVNSHFIFADACRNDVPALRQYVVEGRQILNVHAAAATNPDALTGILYAAASGTQTWQPQELQQGLSLFGNALVQGLQGSAGVELTGCDGKQCEISFYPLQSFVKARMAALLSEFSSPEKARVRQGGSPPEGGITLVPDRTGPRLPPGADSAPISPKRVLAARYDVVHTNLAWAPGGDYGTAHNIFGSERMTDIWAVSARAHDLRTGRDVPRDQIVIREVRRSSDTRAFKISLELPPSPSGHWLSFTDPRGQHFASSLAGSTEGERPVYEVTIDFELDEEPGYYSSRSVSAFEARLSPLNKGLLGHIAKIWRAYESQNVEVALQKLDVGILRELVIGKRSSPLAATVAAVLLLRARQLNQLRPAWLANLSNWFPENSDAPVLRVESERLRAAWHPPVVERQELPRLAERGLPRLAELLPMAWRQFSELAEHEQAYSPGQSALYEQLRQVMRYHRPGGLFAVYASPTDPLGVELVLPRARMM